MSNDVMTAEDLASLRKSLRLTQAEMATEMGMGSRAYQDLEAGTGPIGRRHANNAERVSLRVGVVAARPEVVAAQIRLEATELAAMIRAGSSTGFGFRVIEVEFGPYGEMLGRRPTAKPLRTKAEADAEAEHLASRFDCPSGYNAEHGYWWGRDDSVGRSYRYVVEPA